MPEEHTTFTCSEELLSAVRMRFADTAPLPNESKCDCYMKHCLHTAVSMLAGEIGDEDETYRNRLYTQHLESKALTDHLETVRDGHGFRVAIGALNDWLDGAIKTPPQGTSPGHLLIPCRPLSRQLILKSAALIESEPAHHAEYTAAVVPFFDTKADTQARRLIARAMYNTAITYTSAHGIERLGHPAQERETAGIFAEATAAGFLPEEFWYGNVRISDGQLRFSMAEGIYDTMILRGIDIRPARVDARRLWEDTANFCYEILESLQTDPARHPQNIHVLLQHLSAARSQGSKNLPPTAVVELANIITAKLHTSGGFGEDYDDAPAGRRELLPTHDARALGEGVRRLLYVTRADTTNTEVAQWLSYQDDIYASVVEGLTGLLQVTRAQRRLGNKAFNYSAAQVRMASDRRTVPKPRTFGWKRNRPGYGTLS